MHPDEERVTKELIMRGRKHQELCFGHAEDSRLRRQGCHRNYVGPFWKIPENESRSYYDDPDRGNVSFHSKPNRQVRLQYGNARVRD